MELRKAEVLICQRRLGESQRRRHPYECNVFILCFPSSDFCFLIWRFPLQNSVFALLSPHCGNKLVLLSMWADAIFLGTGGCQALAPLQPMMAASPWSVHCCSHLQKWKGKWREWRDLPKATQWISCCVGLVTAQDFLLTPVPQRSTASFLPAGLESRRVGGLVYTWD